MAVDDYEYHLFEELKSGRLDRRGFLRIASVMGIGAGTASILAACGTTASSGTATSAATASGAPKRGGSITPGFSIPAASPEPINMYDAGSINTVEVACEYLCYPRPDYTLEPKLATSWNSDASGKNWTFNLRQGVKFHDGSTFSADDVIATFALLLNPSSQSGAASAFKGILSAGQIEKVTSNQIIFHLDRPYVDFPYLVSVFNYNTAIMPKNYKIGDFIKGGVGTGPFILKSYVPGQKATFVRNPNYWNSSQPYLDSVNVIYFSNTTAVMSALESGSIDIITLAYQPQSDSLLTNPNLTILSDKSSQTAMLNLRVDQAPFNDKRVRQALAYTLDRQGTLQALFNGRGSIGQDHIFAPIFPTSASALKLPAREQNIAKAKSLLAAAGQTSINVTLTTEQFREIPDWATILKQQAAAAGINVNLNIEPQATFYGSGSNQPWLSVPMGIVDWGERGSPDQFASLALDTGAVWNSAHWSDPAFDQLMKQFEATVDLQKRESIATQAATIMMDETPVIIAYWLDEIRATAKNVHGLAAGPAFPVDFSGVWVA